MTPRGYTENGKTEENKHTNAVQNKKSIGITGTVLIFGGTTEGRLLAERAVQSGIRTVLSVATDYGEEVLRDSSLTSGPEIHKGHLDTDKMISLIDDVKPYVVFDATHPYADKVTASASAAAAVKGIKYIRVRRNIDDTAAAALPDATVPAGIAANAPGVTDNTAVDITYVPDVNAAAAVLDRTAARAFITTDSRGAAAFSRVSRAEERLTLRVLPSEEAIGLCRNAGFKGKNIICMQGPFTVEMNEAMFRASGAELLVTKASGRAGGFPEKIEAARRLGMRIIVVAPPKDIPGISLEEALVMLAGAEDCADV